MFDLNEGTSTPVKKYSIVFADDHVLIRQAIGNYISLLKDFEIVHQCKDGLEVMQYLQHNPRPDIVITDLDMLRTNGHETIQWANTHFPEIKILVFTVFNTEAARQIALNYGADEFAAKNIDVAEMEKVLYRLMAIDGIEQQGKSFLSKRELQFLQLICSDLPFTDIAQRLHVSISAAEKIREGLFEKFKLKTRASLALRVLKSGIVIAQSSNTEN